MVTHPTRQVVTCVGIYTFVVTDLDFSLQGSITSLLMVVATCISQITMEQNIREHGIQSNDLLLECAPYAIVLMFGWLVFVERDVQGRSALSQTPSPSTMLYIVVSACLGLAVNMSTFAIVGRLSALTYKVLAQLKTCLIFVGSVVFLSESYNTSQLVGFLITMAGVVLYVTLQHGGAQQKATTSATTTRKKRSTRRED